MTRGVVTAAPAALLLRSTHSDLSPFLVRSLAGLRTKTYGDREGRKVPAAGLLLGVALGAVQIAVEPQVPVVEQVVEGLVGEAGE